ncbi:hypothetical protein KEK_07322 [Mycolicibacterium thermoresistibile ATCC 19527]|uniref:SnoaL-like domain-containing protein n=1 Tax=Mycolicibacterium thermoresistibile (strain ATCC 19527 / DSM 44167 / CIP 105390 / JCM 6362 / NCTC 10409 / 316) TaxID=1078020 RepID=G7CEP8_MYCT3|nr:hypothetical protein KEK_07322 [Mycolicibacterium thermoresistibile ATCC 19527]SNW19497.1 ketosteroid isomerase-like protein [Mycolicibacterium thermoresistibile]
MAGSDRLDELATRLFTAIERGDAEAFWCCFEPDGVIVRNGTEQRTARSFAERMAGRPADAPAYRYRRVRREFFAGGFLEEHEVHVEPAGTAPVRHACVIGRVGGGGLIRELREYI